MANCILVLDKNSPSSRLLPPFSPCQLTSVRSDTSVLKVPYQMINVPSHIHPLRRGDTSLSQAMLVTEAKITLHIFTWMLWVTPISLRRFLSLWSAPRNQKDSWIPCLNPVPLPAPCGGHTLDHRPSPGPGSAAAVLRDSKKGVPLPCLGLRRLIHHEMRDWTWGFLKAF